MLNEYLLDSQKPCHSCSKLNLYHNYLIYAWNGYLEIEVIYKKKNLKIIEVENIDVPEKHDTLILHPNTKIMMK